MSKTMDIGDLLATWTVNLHWIHRSRGRRGALWRSQKDSSPIVWKVIEMTMGMSNVQSMELYAQVTWRVVKLSMAKALATELYSNGNFSRPFHWPSYLDIKQLPQSYLKLNYLEPDLHYHFYGSLIAVVLINTPLAAVTSSSLRIRIQ